MEMDRGVGMSEFREGPKRGEGQGTAVRPHPIPIPAPLLMG